MHCEDCCEDYSLINAITGSELDMLRKHSNFACLTQCISVQKALVAFTWACLWKKNVSCWIEPGASPLFSKGRKFTPLPFELNTPLRPKEKKTCCSFHVQELLPLFSTFITGRGGRIIE